MKRLLTRTLSLALIASLLIMGAAGPAAAQAEVDDEDSIFEVLNQLLDAGLDCENLTSIAIQELADETGLDLETVGDVTSNVCAGFDD